MDGWKASGAEKWAQKVAKKRASEELSSCSSSSFFVRSAQLADLLTCLPRAIVATISRQRHRQGPRGVGSKVSVFWRKAETGLPTRRHCLIVARNVLTDEVKYFLSNRVPGERNPVTGRFITLRCLLRVAFGRWSIESCFREGKEELGLDHYEVRGWRCVHRHFYVTQLSHLFCARVRQEYDESAGNRVDRISVEQVCSAMNVWLEAADLPSSSRRQRFEQELEKQQYYQRRNRQARASHTKTRLERLTALGIDVNQIKSCLPNTEDR